MVFSSPIFLFYFLPVLILVYFAMPAKFKNLLLLTASLLFYAWGEGFYVLLMLLSIGLNYCFGRIIECNQATRRSLSLGIGVTLNLAILVSYKYANFLVDNLNLPLTLLGFEALDLAPIHLPLGISFFTFQAISYLVDIYRGETKSQKNPINLGLYIALFPQLIAGPIVRYKTIISDISSRQHNAEFFAEGVERFVYGLAKKMLIANPLGLIADIIFGLPAAETATHVVWLGVACYALQIYFDFSGYSDMAIGLGRMFGFRFLENFNYPYSSQSLQEFWRRWHISLSSWFRDYLYIPLGGNRISPARTYVNLFTVFLLCGLWHGASLNFLVWGALHGAVLTLERAGLAQFLSTIWRPIRHLYLLFVVLITWVFFRAETLGDAMQYLRSMFSFSFHSAPFELVEAINSEVWMAGIAGIALAIPVFRKILFTNANMHLEQQGGLRKLKPLTLGRIGLVLLLLTLASIKLASSTHNPFIYFRF
jgi:alginate O-acetyltransferase complex protein AlgI